MALRIVIGALKTRYRKVPVITTDELQHLIKTSQASQRKLVLLDTREECDFRISRLANAIRLDAEETDMTKVIKLIQREARTSQDPYSVAIYCGIGWWASLMSNWLLRELEKPENQDIKSSMEVHNLEGSNGAMKGRTSLTPWKLKN